MRDKAFASYHPIILFVYFTVTIFITMFTMHPVLLGISFVGSIVFCGTLIGVKELFKSLAYSVPILIIIALTNPLFSHNGETILFFLNDNPVTAESICYGVAIAVMIISMYYWFKCYHAVMTSDKFVFLFGRFLPKLALLLSMTLGFVPKLKKRYREINEAQKAMGIYTSKSYVDRIRSKVRVMSILLTWSLENSVDTADSMSARGYGLKGRSSYAIYRWHRQDTVMACIAFALSAGVIWLMFSGYGDYNFYPTLAKIDVSVLAFTLYAGLFILMFLSTVIEIKENLLWRYLRSKI
ncbi:MAG: energy-coupling factor transporter transmembrane protein EcfT [Clostridia bacterium]|nr:energy-coupling factor transporter transmembrane protein EcfT [Clostridia bacterium]